MFAYAIDKNRLPLSVRQERMHGMDLSAYRALWRTLGVPALLIGALLARLPNVAMMIPLSFLAKDASGGFGWAGVVAAAYSMGTALGAPWWSRVADRRGGRRVLVVTGFGWSVFVALLAAMPDDWYRILPAVSLIAGMTLPPVSSTARAAWPRMVSGRRLRTAYALDASTVEVLFVVGPMLGALMVTFASPRAGLLVAAGFAAVTVWWYAQQQPAPLTRTDEDEPRLTVRQLLWHRHRLALIGSFTLTEAAVLAVSLAIVAYADEHGDRLIAGALETVLATGSLIGGLVAGALHSRRPSYAWRRTSLIAIGMAVAAFATWSPWTLGVALFAAGTVLAPAVGALYERLGALTPDSVRTEVFGWMNGGAMLGAAAGSALAGAVIEAAGVPYVLAVASLLALGGAAVMIGVPPHRPEPHAEEVAAGEPTIVPG
jgi:MFS family permease